MSVLNSRVNLLVYLSGVGIMMKNLRAARKRSGLSQRDLAKGLGLSQQAIHKYENGIAEPDLMMLSRIARHLHVSVDYLIDNKYESEQYNIDERMAYVMETFPSLDSEGQDAVTSVLKALERK